MEFRVLAVTLEYQGLGLATKLLDMMINDCLSQGSLLPIVSVCHHRNERSKNLLLRAGFSKVRQEEDYLFYVLSVV